MATTAAVRTTGWTPAGLLIAILGLPIVVLGYRLIVGETSAGYQLGLREAAIFALFGALLWIVQRGEGLPLSSIGVRSGALGKSLLWGLVGFLILASATAAAFGVLPLLGLKYDSSHTGFVVPMWATLLTVIRAGIVEETFYRGYAFERLQALTGSKAVAVIVPLLAFAAFHYRQGFAGVVLALIVGAALSGFYLWRRDLVANIVAHFLIDFIPNIVLPLVAPD